MVHEVVSQEVISKLISELDTIRVSKPDLVFEAFMQIANTLKLKTGTLLTQSVESNFVRKALNVLFEIPEGESGKSSNANYFISLKDDDVIYFGALADIKRRTI